MLKFTQNLISRNDSKIVMLVLDGLGGLPAPDGPYAGKTELEAASTPNMDALARDNAVGLHKPVELGITPGSGPGHLALFGYDPREFQIGRGILEALGLGLEVKETDVAIRCNYATLKDGKVTDRRAGRIPTEKSKPITEKLAAAIPEIDGVKLTFAPGMEHRFAVVFTFPEALEKGADAINDSDPQQEGLAPLSLKPETEAAKKVAEVASKLPALAAEILKDEEQANYLLMRGFAVKPDMPSFDEAFGLRALAVAVYPMYRGLASLVGMDTPVVEGDIKEEIEFLKKNYDDYDFFFVHVKKVDSYGEDGNFDAKVKKIEEVDAALPALLDINPDVLIISGDHSTPAIMKSHSWHPVPTLLKAPYVLGKLAEGFDERKCHAGELGIFPTVSLMPLALAQAGRLKKFGA